MEYRAESGKDTQNIVTFDCQIASAVCELCIIMLENTGMDRLYKNGTTSGSMMSLMYKVLFNVLSTNMS